MQRIDSLYDRISLYELSKLIVEECTNAHKKEKSKSGKNELGSKPEIFKIVFRDVVEPDSSFSTALNKALSEINLSPNSNIYQQLDAIRKNGEALQKIKANCLCLAKKINQYDCAATIYEIMYENCNIVNLGDRYKAVDTEYKKMQKDTDENGRLITTSNFLGELFAHAVKTFDTNSPNLYCERLYQESMTLTESTEMRKHILKEIVATSPTNTYTSCEAAIQYANLVYEDAVRESYEYFKRASNLLTAAFWEIGMMIERGKLDKNLKEDFKTYMRKTHNDSGGWENISIREHGKIVIYQDGESALNFQVPSYSLQHKRRADEEINNIALSFKIYWYVANEKGFSKGWNSVGKYLLKRNVVITGAQRKEDELKTKKEMKEYFRKAMNLGNINAMVNLASVYFEEYKEGTLADTHKEIMLTLLKNGADYFKEKSACYLLAQYYWTDETDKNDNLAKKYFEEADRLNLQDAELYRILGDIYAKTGESNKSISYYEKAIAKGNYESALHLMNVYFSLAADEDDNREVRKYLTKGIACERYLSDMGEGREEAEECLKRLKHWFGTLE